jgi:LacI family transcriptional regulator
MSNEMTGSDRPRRVTLADVAAQVGVSKSTASRALSGDPRISEPTRNAVLAAAESLGFVPDASARSLRVRSTRTLGMLLAELSDPYQGQVAAAFEAQARSHGYTVLFLAGHYRRDRERLAIGIFVERRVDGIALVSSVTDPVEIQARWGQDRIVDVQPDAGAPMRGGAGLRGDPRPGVIRTDDVAGITACVNHLVDRGCRSVTYLGVTGRAGGRLRRDAARRVLMDRAGTALHVVEVGADAVGNPALVADALGVDLPEAILCYDDSLALVLLHGLRARGVRVPRDVAVVGFDGIPFSALSNPRLTTVLTPMSEIGRLAADTLVQAIETGSMAEARVLPVELAIRDSSDPSATGGSGRRPQRRQPMSPGAGKPRSGKEKG